MESTNKQIVSVITACYRGSNFLPRAFESLRRQKGEHSIEWIIVDDFSNDGNKTRNTIEQIEKDSPFPIKVIYLDKNYYGSKCTYTGAQNATGTYSIILDQDDMLTENAIDKFCEIIHENGNEDSFAGVCGRCITLEGQMIGTPFPWQGKLSNELDIRYVNKIRGELFQITKTKILLKFFKDMKPGYTNGWAWLNIAREYQYFYTNTIFRIYDTTNPDSHTNLKKLNYVEAVFEQASQQLVSNSDYIMLDKMSCIRTLLWWSQMGLHLKINFKEQLRLLPSVYAKYFIFIFPVAVFREKRVTTLKA